jgi:hypothetical protein
MDADLPCDKNISSHEVLIRGKPSLLSTKIRTGIPWRHNNARTWRDVRPMTSPAGIAWCHVIGRVSFIVCYDTEFRSEQSKGMQRYHEFCRKSALKLLILWWVVVYDKYKTTLVSDPRHRIALVDFLRPESPRPPVGENQRVRSGDSDQTLMRFSYYNAGFHQEISASTLFIENQLRWGRDSDLL